MTLSPKDLERALAALDGQPLESLQIVTAERVANQHYPQLNPSEPALLLALTGADMARCVQRVLMSAYPAEHGVILIDEDATTPIALVHLGENLTGPTEGDEQAGASLFLPPLPAGSDYVALQEVVARLRAPDGCPWDRELTWDKLRASLLEETYELLAALDAGDPHKVAEEQGDLLLQIALQTQIAVEENLFRSPDVIRGIVSKLIRRHPHVFGDVKVSGTDEVLANWETIKAAERASNHEKKRSPLAGIPMDLPALAQSDAYLDRMSRLQTPEAPPSPCAELANLPAGAPVTAENVGKALFDLVAWAHARGVDAESALRATNQRYAANVEKIQG
jgi:tetrapyrrole methylase family protein/MazG family protein